MTYIANIILPLITLIVIIYALYKKVNIYDEFLSGVKEGLQIGDFTINNALERIKRKGDIFAPVLGEGIDMRKAIERIQWKVNCKDIKSFQKKLFTSEISQKVQNKNI